MLKSYSDRCELQAPVTVVSTEALSSAETPVPRVSLVTVPAGSEGSSAETESTLSDTLTEGKLSNSVVLQDLPARLSHLTEAQCADIVSLIYSNRELFSDVPVQTHLLSYDIDVEGSGPIKQHLTGPVLRSGSVCVNRLFICLSTALLSQELPVFACVKGKW